MTLGGSWWRDRRLASGLAVAAVTAGSCALALRWVYLVPIFQAPDEPSHFDYVMTVYSGGLGALRTQAVDGSGEYSHPYVRYLVSQTGFYYVVFQSDHHVAPDYGRSGYFRALDAAAPPGPGNFRPVLGPFLANQYPAGFYAITALWLKALGVFTGSGPVALLFTARLFSVVLIALTLPLSYLVARRSGFGRPLALALTAVLAYFPLRSFTGSYVQPDDLAWFLATLGVYLALRARAASWGAPWLLGLGTVLGLLLVTKLQFYLPVLAALGAVCLAGRLGRADSGRRLPRGPVVAALVLGPSVLTGALQAAIEPGPVFPFGFWVSHGGQAGVISMRALTAAAHQGLGNLAWYVVDTAHTAFSEYCFGGTSYSYWGRFGWQDVPLVIGSARLTALLHDAVVAANVVVLLLLALYLQQALVRAGAEVRRGRAEAALAAFDPFLVAYLLFALEMFALYIATAGTAAPQGRDWLPFMLPAFAAGTVYCWRVFAGGRFRAAATALSLAALLAYSAAGSAYALQDVSARYYGPGPEVSRLPGPAGPALPAGQVAFALDPPAAGAAAITADGDLTVTGWAFDLESRQAPSGVWASVDGGREFPGLLGLARPEAVASRGAAAASSGFAVELVDAGLAPGAHRLRLRFEFGPGPASFEPAPIPFSVRG